MKNKKYQLKFLFFIVFVILFLFAFTDKTNSISKTKNFKLLKLEMSISAFGVENDSFPTIDMKIDFNSYKNNCVKSYYNPDIKSTTFSITRDEILHIEKLLTRENLNKLKNNYKTSTIDQPNATIIIYTNFKTYIVNDYGLLAEFPISKLYDIVLDRKKLIKSNFK
jgi:hypothetical protein